VAAAPAQPADGPGSQHAREGQRPGRGDARPGVLDSRQRFPASTAHARRHDGGGTPVRRRAGVSLPAGPGAVAAQRRACRASVCPRTRTGRVRGEAQRRRAGHAGLPQRGREPPGRRHHRLRAEAAVRRNHSDGPGRERCSGQAVLQPGTGRRLDAGSGRVEPVRLGHAVSGRQGM
jgi:hypothetical protein